MWFHFNFWNKVPDNISPQPKASTKKGANTKKETIESLKEQLDIQKKEFESELNKKTSELKAQLENKEKEIQKMKRQLIEINKREEKEIQEKKSVQQNKLIKILDSETIHNLEEIEEIGYGNGGRVMKVAMKKIYALKIMKIGKNNHNVFKKFVNEYEIMNMLDHPNILKTYGIFFSDEKMPPSILLEYCPLNLSDLIQSKSLSKVEIVISIYQIVEGMKYVHFRNVIHRDLKPSNILIAVDEKTIKIGDFGISKLMNAEEQSMTGGVGTQKFMAPEIIDENDDYDEKVDVYSFGVLLFFMLSSGNLPKIKMSDKMKGKKAEIPNSFTQFSTKLISSCWNFNSKDRPSFEQILKDLELNNYDLVKLNSSEIAEVRQLINEHKEKIPDYK